MDYSGSPGADLNIREGITYFDHPDNPGQPTGWHVRDDGWMCASPTMKHSLITRRDAPLRLRYLLLIHKGAADVARNQSLSDAFSASLPRAAESSQPHTRWKLHRSPPAPAGGVGAVGEGRKKSHQTNAG